VAALLVVGQRLQAVGGVDRYVVVEGMLEGGVTVASLVAPRAHNG